MAVETSRAQDLARRQSGGDIVLRQDTLAIEGEDGNGHRLRAAGVALGAHEPMSQAGRIHVWDLPVRLIFPGLILAPLAAWYFAVRDPGLHMIAGYVAGAFLVVRLVWAIVGSRFARFSDFVYSPLAVIRHVIGMFRFETRRYIGHDPLSGFLTWLTLLLLGFVVASGWAMSGGVDREIAWVRRAHLIATNALIVLVPFHILAALISGWLHGDNPVEAMFSGWKRLDRSDVLPAVVETAELRLHDRMRAIEALAVMTLLSGAALGLGLMFRAPDRSVQAVGVRAPVPAPPTVSEADKTALLAAIGEQRAAALRDVAAAKAEAERDIAARSKGGETVDTSALVAGQIEKMRDQVRAELLAELQKQQAAARPAPTAAPAPAPAPPSAVQEPALQRTRSGNDPTLRQILAAGGYDRTNIPAMISAGGRLYDNWYAMLGKPSPTAAHPSWPQGRQAASAGDTWRCASCHGFDYRGDPGSTRLGGAGIPYQSVRNAEKMSIEKVVGILGDARHSYSDDVLPRSSKIELGMFLVKGQYTSARYFGADGRAKGSATRGKERFVQVCASCHGFDGRLSVKPNGASLGAIAVDSPAEMFHKIRNGHPGAMNAAMRPTPLSVQSDLLAYVQSLPR